MVTFVGGVLAWLVRTLGLPLCALLAFYAYEEGIPGAERIRIPSSVPIVGGIGLVDIPVIGNLTAGRVQTFAAGQVRIANAASKAVCDARVEKLVSNAQYEALAAELESERRQRLIAEQLNTDAMRRAGAAKRAMDAALTKLEEERPKAAQDGSLSWPTEGDMEWMSKH